jgi:hypothetical protein
MEPSRRRDGRATLDAPLAPDEELLIDRDTGDVTVVHVPGADDPRIQQVHLPEPLPKAEARRRILTQKALLLRHEGYRMIDIAEQLGIATNTLIGWIAQHKQRLKLTEIDEQIERIALPIATDNLIHGLLAGDKDYTLETLKGRGKLRRYTNQDANIVHELPTLRVEFTTPPAAAGYRPEEIAMGRIVGAPALAARPTLGEHQDQAIVEAQFQVEQAMHERPPGPEPDE